MTDCGRGEEAYRLMKKAGLEVYVIPLAVISYILPKVDYCLVGAEGVVRSGGIVNRIGTFPIALCAKQAQKPFYCIAESYKFVDKVLIFNSIP